MDKKIITFEKEIKERKKSENYNNSIFQQNKQIEFINKLFQNIEFDEKKICISEIKTKLNSYKNQDLQKKRSIDNIINFDEIIEKLISSQLKCFYCRVNMKIVFENVREPTQWTLDRLNNYYAHNNNNVVICCLKCNLQRRRQNHKSFKFSKQLVITKEK